MLRKNIAKTYNSTISYEIFAKFTSFGCDDVKLFGNTLYIGYISRTISNWGCLLIDLSKLDQKKLFSMLYVKLA